MAKSPADPRTSIDQTSYPKLETKMVKEASTFLRRLPGPSSAAETELLYGTRFHIHRIGRGWVFGQAESMLPGRQYPGYVGWIRARHLGEADGETSHKITAISAPVFKAANIKSPVLLHLPLSSTVIGQSEGDFLRSSIGFIHDQHVQTLFESPDHRDWIAVAESLLGRPYVWGGISSVGLDCSGLVQTSLRVMGSDIPRDTDQQVNIGFPVPMNDDLSNLERGDLVFWKGHVGIMRTSTELLHANAYHMAVASEPLSTAIDRIGLVTSVRRLPG